MQSIIAVLRAAHCRSVHHFFAIDALREVQTDSGQRLANLLLAHFSRYLAGAKDPDTAFKDFQNHVVHVDDNFWGGAAITAESWMSQTYRHLRAGKWSDAAYALGVLSHYFTDPWMPLHTGQTSREAIYHRPLEWSVCCAYEEIFQLALSNSELESFEIPQSNEWIRDSIHAGAILSHQFYNVLLDDYELKESRLHPALALGDRSKHVLSQLFTWVLTAWGGAIDRIAIDCQVNIPPFSLLWPTLLASTNLPVAKITKSITSVQQRREVEAILHEYLATGSVKRNLPEEQVMVARVRKRQPSLAPSIQDQERAKALPIVQENINPSKRKPQEVPQTTRAKPTAIQTKPDETSEKHKLETRDQVETPRKSKSTESEQPASRRVQILRTSPVVDAPGIGPKTAERLQRVGIHSIDDLLKCDIAQVAMQLKSWIKAEMIEQWKVQALLACEIQGLSAAGAGLLTLAGITSSEAILLRSAEELHQLVLTASQTAEGQRVLRSKSPPPIAAIRKWQNSARSRGAESQ